MTIPSLEELWRNRIEQYDNKESWLAQRHTYIGGSAVPALFGQGYVGSSPLSIWQSIVHPDLSEPLEGEYLDWGNRLEPAIADEYMNRTGNKLWGNGYNIWRHPEHKHIACTPDFIDFENRENVQIKNVGQFAAKEWDNDEYPLKYMVQVQHEMLATGMESSKLVALIGGQSLEIRHIERDNEWINDMLIPTINGFWDNYVIPKIEPPVDGLEGTVHALFRLHPDDNGKAVELPPEFMHKFDDLDEIKEKIKDLKADETLIKSEIKSLLGDNTYGETADGRCAAWKTQTKKAYDIPKDVKGKYQVEDSKSRVLRFSKSLPRGVTIDG